MGRGGVHHRCCTTCAAETLIPSKTESCTDEIFTELGLKEKVVMMGIYWILLGQDRVQWQALLNTAQNLWARGNVFTS
jgi:hypothetical protein